MGQGRHTLRSISDPVYPDKPNKAQQNERQMCNQLANTASSDTQRNENKDCVENSPAAYFTPQGKHQNELLV